MSEEKDVTPVPEDPNQSEKVKEAFQAFANKCFELGNAVYKMDVAQKDFELQKHNWLVDIDKLAKEHDKILNKAKTKIELPKAPEVEA